MKLYFIVKYEKDRFNKMVALTFLQDFNNKEGVENLSYKIYRAKNTRMYIENRYRENQN